MSLPISSASALSSSIMYMGMCCFHVVLKSFYCLIALSITSLLIVATAIRFCASQL